MGSLTEVQHSIVVGTLLGDGAMRCKTNALLEVITPQLSGSTSTGSIDTLLIWFLHLQENGRGTEAGLRIVS